MNGLLEHERPIVGIVQNPGLTGYDSAAPFSPGVNYPEYPYQDAGGSGNDVDTAGLIYGLIRRLLAEMGLDASRFGQPSWNPFGEFIRPGDTVLIKPNLVRHQHVDGGDLSSLITHASVLRPLIDYVTIALGDSGSLAIGDAPLQDADFAAVTAANGLDDVVAFCREKGRSIDVVDFRREWLPAGPKRSHSRRKSLPGDPNGYARVELDETSWLSPVDECADRFRVTCYNPAEMARHHGCGRHEYLIAGSVLGADVVINVPKLKTHAKAGITACLKNVVGINGNKDWLPHHRQGAPARGGDEYAHSSMMKSIAGTLLDRANAAGEGSQVHHGTLLRAVAKMGRLTARDQYEEGSWYGNDTIWRTVLDLNRILLYASRDGVMHSTPQRRVFHVVDGVVAGEGNGPLRPSPRPIGLAMGGVSGAAVDALAARLMGFDYRRIPLIRHALVGDSVNLAQPAPPDVQVLSDSERWRKVRLSTGGDSLRFLPADGWLGHIELEPSGRGEEQGIAALQC